MAGSDIYGFESLFRAYRDCRRNKRNTLNALAFELDAEALLLTLQRELRQHTYQPGRSICFVTDGPKPREVFAADFRDRIVHHLLVHHQERVFETRFIHDSYACRRGKGTLAASDRLMRFMARVSANGRRAAWVLKLDVASFFSSIHKQTLYAMIARRIRNPEILWLTRTVLFHDPTRNYRFRPSGRSGAGPESERYPIPCGKSLFEKDNQRGLPIGNLTSQFWANVYLNELDQFVKRTLRCPYYVRYVDDMVLLSADREALIRWRGAIEQFLRARLHLELRADGQEPMPVLRGVGFVGWKTFWNYRVPRRGTISRMRNHALAFERSRVRPAFGELGWRIDLGRNGRRPHPAGRSIGTRSVERLRQSLASYSGHLRHGAAWGAWSRTCEEFPWLALLFLRQGWRFKVRWLQRRRLRAGRFQDEYARLARAANGDCLAFCRVGRFVEFYGPQRVLAERVLGLRRIYRPRAGYGFAVGFPVWLAARFVRKALQLGCAVATMPSEKRVRAYVPTALLWPKLRESPRPTSPSGRRERRTA